MDTPYDEALFLGVCRLEIVIFKLKCLGIDLGRGYERDIYMWAFLN